MALLVLGVALWLVVHSLPIWAPARRDRLRGRMGEKPWKGAFSVVSLLTIVLIVIGWNAADPAAVAYWAPAWGVHVNNLLMLLAVGAFGLGHSKAYPRRWVRNPQLTAVLLWGVAHLFANGEWRSIVLFGGFALWGALGILGTNRRDGPWTPPEALSAKRTAIWAAVTVAVFIVLVVIHPWLFGAWPLPG
jgi:uncharacterized membrane protein